MLGLVVSLTNKEKSFVEQSDLVWLLTWVSGAC